MTTRTRILSVFVSVAAAAALVSAAPAAAAEPDTPPTARPSLAAPTGHYPVGTTDMHLVDTGRADPWVPDETRQLMVTVWYPARAATGTPAAYTGRRLAGHLDETVTPSLGLKRGQVDWAHIGTHATTAPPAAPGSRPVVLYSPGGFESRRYGTGAAVDLASHGYVVVAVDHTYESPVEFTGRLAKQRVVTGPSGQLDPAVLRKMDAVRVRDVRFVLDELALIGAGQDPDAGGRALPRGLGRALDLSSVGVFGHSAGGDTAAETLHEDPRIDAAVDMDGFLAYDSQGEHPMPVAERGLRKPFLLMGSRSTVDRLPPPGQEPDWKLRSHRSAPAWSALWRQSSGPKLDLGIPQGRHHVFTDQLAVLPQLARLGVPRKTVTDLIGTNPCPPRVLRSEHAYIGAFFDQYLRHRHRPLLDGPSTRHPDIRFVR